MFDYYYILTDILPTELQQCADEGRDCAAFSVMVEQLKKLPEASRESVAEAIYNALMELPENPNLKKAEPIAWEGILDALPVHPAPVSHGLSREAIQDRVLGAWQARIAGCLLGKPFEGAPMADIAAYFGLKPGTYAPLSYYRAREDEPVEFLKSKEDLSIDRLHGMPADDDTNYTTLALALVEKKGKGFTMLDWADHFLRSLPPEATFTAERVAYRNLLDLRLPPETPHYRNPYREWIGAQIRADLYGYLCPGDPLAAAQMAYTDAAITHIRNGVYGAMWVAASLALAYAMPAGCAIRQALSVLPPHSRLTQALADAIADYDAGLSWEEATRKLRARWDEKNTHHWCHVISNAVIVANAILYGEDDLTRTLSLAVLPGFDTDCNGATAGSILGMSLGAKKLDSAWIAPLQDQLEVTLAGMDGQPISGLARRTAALIDA